jgi:glyoxylase I family protein
MRTASDDWSALRTLQEDMFTAIDHPAITCYDVQKQIDWYCATLGMRVVASNGQQPPSVMIGYDSAVTGATMLELMPTREAGPKPAEVARFAPGLRHVALRVKDFDQAYNALKAAGVKFLMEPMTAVGGGKIVSFRDPEGNELQIVQR